MTDPYKYYDPEKYGPMPSIKLERKYCYLSGGSLMCPSLEKVDPVRSDSNAEFRCKRFDVDLGNPVKTSLRGTMGTPAPIPVPPRCDECIDGECLVQMVVLITNMDEGENGDSE